MLAATARLHRRRRLDRSQRFHFEVLFEIEVHCALVESLDVELEASFHEFVVQFVVAILLLERHNLRHLLLRVPLGRMFAVAIRCRVDELLDLAEQLLGAVEDIFQLRRGGVVVVVLVLLQLVLIEHGQGCHVYLRVLMPFVCEAL